MMSQLWTSSAVALVHYLKYLFFQVHAGCITYTERLTIVMWDAPCTKRTVRSTLFFHTFFKLWKYNFNFMRTHFARTPQVFCTTHFVFSIVGIPFKHRVTHTRPTLPRCAQLLPRILECHVHSEMLPSFSERSCGNPSRHDAQKFNVTAKATLIQAQRYHS